MPETTNPQTVQNPHNNLVSSVGKGSLAETTHEAVLEPCSLKTPRNEPEKPADKNVTGISPTQRARIILKHGKTFGETASKDQTFTGKFF